MNYKSISRVVSRLALGATLCFSESCVEINEHLGQNFIPYDQLWDVFSAEAPLEDIRLLETDEISGYDSYHMVFGAVYNGPDDYVKAATSFTLIPADSSYLDFGENTRVRQFHISAVKDTTTYPRADQKSVIQNIYVYPMKKALDSLVLYSGSFAKNQIVDGVDTGKKVEELYVDKTKTITAGIPTYNGNDSLSIDLDKKWSLDFINTMKEMEKADRDSIHRFIEKLPGIYIETDLQETDGGRINMFRVGMEYNTQGLITGNYAELKITADYGERKDVDTSFVFLMGPVNFAKHRQIPNQFAYNAKLNSPYKGTPAEDGFGYKAHGEIGLNGGIGVKPVIKGEEMFAILVSMLEENGITDIEEQRKVIINRATIVMPFDEKEGYQELEKYPVMLSPTCRLTKENSQFVTYAGITDASVESENKGELNRSLNTYRPDISFHIQQMFNKALEAKAEAKKDFDFTKYNIWMMIMHKEQMKVSYIQNNTINGIPYDAYYNSMMYDPYGYGGYGYGYGGYDPYGYGYGGYNPYGYNNYYNYYMMQQMMNPTQSNEKSSMELDNDRYYKYKLYGSQTAGDRYPKLKIVYSIPGKKKSGE